MIKNTESNLYKNLEYIHYHKKEIFNVKLDEIPNIFEIDGIKFQILDKENFDHDCITKLCRNCCFMISKKYECLVPVKIFESEYIDDDIKKFIYGLSLDKIYNDIVFPLNVNEEFKDQIQHEFSNSNNKRIMDIKNDIQDKLFLSRYTNIEEYINHLYGLLSSIIIKGQGNFFNKNKGNIWFFREMKNTKNYVCDDVKDCCITNIDMESTMIFKGGLLFVKNVEANLNIKLHLFCANLYIFIYLMFDKGIFNSTEFIFDEIKNKAKSKRNRDEKRKLKESFFDETKNKAKSKRNRDEKRKSKESPEKNKYSVSLEQIYCSQD